MFNYIKKIKYDKLEMLILVLFVFISVLIPLSHYIILTTANYVDSIQNSIYFVSILLFFSILLIRMNNNLERKWSMSILCISLLVVLSLLSFMSSMDYVVSLLGFQGRHEGVAMLFSYYTIFVSSTFIKSNKKKLLFLNILLFIGIIHAVYGILQYFHFFPEIIINKYGDVASGLAGNPNFFGSFIVLMIGLSAGLFYYSDHLIKKLYYLFFAVVFIVAMFLSKTMSALFGTGIIAIVMFTYIAITHKKKRINSSGLFTSRNIMLIGLIILLSVGFIFNLISDGYLFAELLKMYKEVTQMVGTGEINESFGSGRFLVWANTLTLVPKYFLFGSGIDTFGLAYHETFPLNLGMFFDKVHNEYLQIAITMGIPALITYLSLYGSVIVQAVKRFILMYYNEYKDKEHEGMYFGLFLAVIGYLFQAFFNISVIDVAPYFWILLGLLADSNHKVKRIIKLENGIQTFSNGNIEEINEIVQIDE